MARDSDHLIYVITAIVCFFLGYYSFPQNAIDFDILPLQADHPYADLYPESLAERWAKSRILVQDEEIHARQTFQELLRKQHQSSTDCSRMLILPIQYNSGLPLSWIDSLETIARALKVALSTQRRLIVQISGDKKESFCGSAEHEIYCQFIKNHHVSECHTSTDKPTFPSTWTSPLRQGVQEDMSDFFNVRYYGNDDVAVLPNTSAWPWPKSWLLEGGLSWERSWGAFWLFSQLLRHLTDSTLGHPDDNLKKRLSVSDPIHITLVWDPEAQHSLKHTFARISEKTHAWDRIQVLANYLRGEYNKETKNETYGIAHWKLVIVVITNEFTTNHTIPFQSWDEEGWEVSIIQINSRDKPQPHVLNSVYSSEFLIGSFASPFFRVLTAHSIIVGLPPIIYVACRTAIDSVQPNETCSIMKAILVCFFFFFFIWIVPQMYHRS